jgi:4-hydroxy-tetrahydrodipicolinate reductase
MTTKVAIAGATGKMGRMIGDLVDEAEGFEVVARLDSRSELEEMLGADVVVDVTIPGVSQKVVDFAVSHGINVLVGTSGWSGDRISALRHAVDRAGGVGVVIIPNFSIGSVLATSFATMAARFYDSIEIVEAHSSTKVDSPSGTAVRTAELIGAARASLGPVAAPHTDQRARGQQVASVPVHSLRLSGIVAKQDVVLGGTGEVLTITHETISPSAYSAGIRLALDAVRTVRGVTVGLDQLIDISGEGPAVVLETDPIPENVSGQVATVTSVTP